MRKNDPSYIPPPNPPKPNPVPAPSSKEYYDSIDEAAIDFVLQYGADSISSCREYAAAINKLEIDGKTMYAIGKLDIGPVRTDANGGSDIYWDESTVAFVHTHGQYVVPENNQFSNQDKKTARQAPFGDMMFAYVGVPAGVVRKYDPWNNSDVIIFSNAPR